MSESIWANFAQGNYLSNVSPWVTDNFHEENNLYNVGLTCLVLPQVTEMKLKAKYHASEKHIQEIILKTKLKCE